MDSERPQEAADQILAKLDFHFHCEKDPVWKQSEPQVCLEGFQKVPAAKSSWLPLFLFNLILLAVPFLVLDSFSGVCVFSDKILRVAGSRQLHQPVRMHRAAQSGVLTFSPLLYRAS